MFLIFKIPQKFNEIIKKKIEKVFRWCSIKGKIAENSFPAIISTFIARMKSIASFVFSSIFKSFFTAKSG